MIENVIPLGNRVITKKIDKKDEKSGNIFIPDVTGEKPVYAVVVAVGEGAHTMAGFVPTTVEVGDEVLLPKVGSIKFKIGTQEYSIIEEHHLLLKMKKS